MALADYKTHLETLLKAIPNEGDNAWGYVDQIKPIIDKTNRIIGAVNAELGRTLPSFAVRDSDYSSSRKTFRFQALRNLKTIIQVAIDEISKEERLRAEKKAREDAEQRKFHCFKVNSPCPHVIKENQRMFFVGMPFSDTYRDSYEYGIKIALESHGCDVYRADGEISNFDLMCKICKAIQESKYVIINLSEQNPNVAFELGLAYGLGKYVLLIKAKGRAVQTDLSGLEYVEYSHAGDLRDKMLKWMTEKGFA